MELSLAGKAMEDFRRFADMGNGVLLITHDIELALKVADRIAVFLSLIHICPCWNCGSFCSAECTVVADSGGIVADRNDRISGLSCNQTSPLFEAGVTLER